MTCILCGQHASHRAVWQPYGEHRTIIYAVCEEHSTAPTDETFEAIEVAILRILRAKEGRN